MPVKQIACETYFLDVPQDTVVESFPVDTFKITLGESTKSAPYLLNVQISPEERLIPVDNAMWSKQFLDRVATIYGLIDRRYSELNISSLDSPITAYLVTGDSTLPLTRALHCIFACIPVEDNRYFYRILGFVQPSHAVLVSVVLDMIESFVYLGKIENIPLRYKENEATLNEVEAALEKKLELIREETNQRTKLDEEGHIIVLENTECIKRSELEQQAHRDKYGSLTFRLSLPVISHHGPIIIYVTNNALLEVPIDDVLVDIINDLLHIHPGELARIKQLLYENYRYIASISDCGEPHAENPRDPLGIPDAVHAYEESRKPRMVYIESPSKSTKHRFAGIHFYPSWEDEHGTLIVIKNGQIVGTACDPGHYEEFEN